MNGLLELAERVEAATGPDRKLDSEIVHAALRWNRSDIDEGVVPEFTSSLDAAMTLMPEGWQGERLSWWAGCGALCTLEETHLVDGEWVREKGWLGRVEGDAATPALAMTAACLRARAAGEPK